MYFTSPTSTISSIASMSSSTASSLAMDIRPRSSSSCTSTSGYSAWPYRSSVINATSSEEPSSYLSDEDLFFSADEEATASPEPEPELSTEDHIAMLRKAAEQGEVNGSNFWYNQFQQPRQPRRYSRPRPEEQKKPQSSMGKRKKSTSKKVIFATPAQNQG